MNRRNWNRYRPNCLREAIEACLDYAREKHHLSVDQVADRIGLASKWPVYKWIEGGSIPARQIRALEHATGATFITGWIASSAHKLLVDIPTGRVAQASDVQQLQEACTQACGALIEFVAGRLDADATRTALTAAMERLALERAQLDRHHQPELNLT